MDRHRAGRVVHAVDAGAAEREALPGPEPADLPGHAHRERLVRGPSGQHVDADARAVVVVEAGVPRLPPGVQPRLGVRRPPEQSRLARAGAIERARVDVGRRGARELGALGRRQDASGVAQSCDRRLVHRDVSLQA